MHRSSILTCVFYGVLHPIALFAIGWDSRITSPVGLTAMPHTPNLDCVTIGADEEETIIANAQPKLFSSLESFHVAYARFCEAVQR